MKLKPCPFCGSKLIKIYGVMVFHGECTMCGARSELSKTTREEAIRLWNTRSNWFNRRPKGGGVR